MNLSAKDLIKALEAHGFVFKRSRGPHRIYYNKNTNKLLLCQCTEIDLAKGTFLAILKQAGLSQEDI